MNNDYFKNLINGSGGSGSGSGKFDLKQVAEFDKQNKKDEERRSKAKAKSGKGGGEGGKGSGGGGGGGGKYRDRAGERRKQGDASEMEEAASRLDIEQSKHLGGDVEHTHLVKGLDYTLLQKMRGPPGVPVGSGGSSGPPGMPVRAGPPGVPVGALVSSSFSSTTASMSALARKAQREQEQRLAESDRNTRPITEMGRALKQLLEDRREATGARGSSGSIGAGGSALQRTQYEFALHDKDDDDDALDSDLPTIIHRAKSEIQIDEAVASGEIPSDVLARLVEAFRSLSSSGGAKKRKRDGDKDKDKKKEAQATVPGHAMLLQDPGLDIFADVGKYVPVGALEPDERDSAAQSAKGLFGPDLGASEESAASTAAKLKLINAVVTEQERHIELKTLELEKKSAQGFAQSEYDIFPDNVDFENVAGSDDDEDDEETKARKKKSREKLGVGAGGGVKK